jgi:hypothetical protein
MRDERFEVRVSFDERRGYVGTAPSLRSPVTALSLGGLRRRIEAALVPDEVHVVLSLDRAARTERDAQAAGRAKPGEQLCGGEVGHGPETTQRRRRRHGAVLRRRQRQGPRVARGDLAEGDHEAALVISERIKARILNKSRKPDKERRIAPGQRLRPGAAAWRCCVVGLPVSHDVPDARQRRSDHGEQTNDHYWRLRRVRRYV